MENEKREPGYYWVRTDTDWFIIEAGLNGDWCLLNDDKDGNPRLAVDEDFNEIDAHRIDRDEHTQIAALLAEKAELKEELQKAIEMIDKLQKI